MLSLLDDCVPVGLSDWSVNAFCTLNDSGLALRLYDGLSSVSIPALLTYNSCCSNFYFEGCSSAPEADNDSLLISNLSGLQACSLRLQHIHRHPFYRLLFFHIYAFHAFAVESQRLHRSIDDMHNVCNGIVCGADIRSHAVFS